MITAAQSPAHNHALNASTGPATTQQAGVNVAFATVPTGAFLYPNPPSKDPSKLGSLAASTVGASGGSAAHDNLMPYLSVNFIICRNGIYPSFD